MKAYLLKILRDKFVNGYNKPRLAGRRSQETAVLKAKYLFSLPVLYFAQRIFRFAVFQEILILLH